MKSPEYLALIISTLAIVMSVLIANKNRKHQFCTEEYFKLQQIAEQITSKLILMEEHKQKYIILFEGLVQAKLNKSQFTDTNDTFNKSNFERDCELTAAYIAIYFPEQSEKYNICIQQMSNLITALRHLNEVIKTPIDFDQKTLKKEFDKHLSIINNLPIEISEDIQEKLNKYKREKL